MTIRSSVVCLLFVYLILVHPDHGSISTPGFSLFRTRPASLLFSYSSSLLTVVWRDRAKMFSDTATVEHIQSGADVSSGFPHLTCVWSALGKKTDAYSRNFSVMLAEWLYLIGVSC